MDLLRRIFGLQPAPTTSSVPPSPTVDVEGPTAPLEGRRGVLPTPPPTPTDTADFDPGKTNITVEDGHTRRLPEMEVPDGSKRGQIVFGYRSDVGQVRATNQDAIMTILSTAVTSEEPPNIGIFVVADGMGGHHDGERASAIAARTVVRYTNSELVMPVFRRQEDSADRPTITEILRLAVQEANTEVSKEVPEGGTTVTVATIVGDLAYIGHVGDSRAYIITNEGIEQLTRDHSLVQRLIELDQLTPEEAVDHPQRNVLYRAIGQNESVDVDAITRRLPPGSRLLLCSDGLWNLVPEEEIRNTVTSSPSPQAACEALVKLANARGGPDNISVVIVKMPE